MRHRALGGGPLCGDKLVRLVYLDESGTGDAAKEPDIIVAGVIVHADKQWKLVEQRLSELADQFANPAERAGFYFHAADLYTGGRAGFRDKHPLAKRHELLRELCEIPAQFDLPVVMQAISRQQLKERYPTLSNSELVCEGLQQATLACALGIEDHMRKCASDEVAMLVFEENGKTDKALRRAHNLFKSDAGFQGVKPARIAETLLFAGKKDSSLLQLADVCAYVFQRRMRGAPIDDKFYRPIVSNLTFGRSSLMVGRGQSSWAARGLERPA